MGYGRSSSKTWTGTNGDEQNDPGFEDRYIREAMFGGSFGAFRTAGCHFFAPYYHVYQRIAAIARIRRQADPVGLALHRGRQYPRETSFLGLPFTTYGPGERVAWSRILFQQEVLVALNTNGAEGRGAEVTVDNTLHVPGTTIRVLYHSGGNPATLANPPQGQTVFVQQQPDGRATVRVDLPPPEWRSWPVWVRTGGSDGYGSAPKFYQSRDARRMARLVRRAPGAP